LAVIVVGAKKQMLRVNASWRVASVADAIVSWINASINKIRDAMSAVDLLAYFEVAITPRVNMSSPQPAAAGCYQEECIESLERVVIQEWDVHTVYNNTEMRLSLYASV
jgi:hypothetical protein